ncbi:hypothetical protein SAMN05421820_111220 [Pedobacter steynii]|uniref:Lipocalin-like domain-containing protein n=1 Tax=Pedobacter steynii TaxID=430522 RepID=A0A1H0GQQ5_9SPHI|nr:hypothetical protein [Pedobacter steynii]NQX42496.1 hypothetical protein [Pedobacter steynii]SDO09233.1 hypothetical protein SAMN05421820_111220 [Pedobacter steynii]
MKKQITLVVMVLMMIAGITTGCKKETGADAPLKTKIVGRWQVAKVETTVTGTPPTTYTGVAGDFLEFRGDENDQMEFNYGKERALGNYVVFGLENINLSFSGKLFNCVINTLTDNKLEFTATSNGVTPAETRKFFLTK